MNFFENFRVFTFVDLWSIFTDIRSYAVNISLNKNHWLFTASEYFAGVSITPQQTQIKGNVALKEEHWIKLTKCTVHLPTRMIYTRYFY